MSSKKFLVIQLRQLGDILLTTPIAKAIKDQYPDAHVTFFSHAMGKLVLKDNPYINEHLVYTDADRIATHRERLAYVRAQKFDVVFDFMNNPRSALYSFWSRAPKSYSYDSWRSFLYTNTLKRDDSRGYIVDHKFKLLELEKIVISDRQLVLPWSDQDSQPVKKFIEENATFKNAKLRVALSPTHRRVARQWPLEKFAQVAKSLEQKYGASVVWLWGPGEEEMAQNGQRLAPNSLIMPKTNFREMAAFIANCDLFIGNSNGPSHVSVAVDTPSIQLHGPTKLQSWCPMTKRHRGLQAKPHLQSLLESEVMYLLQQMLPQIEAAASARRQEQRVRNNWLDQPYN
jgi:heptosyltransferase-2/heptosyltransferase-3